jgi:hypothetical protein
MHHVGFRKLAKALLAMLVFSVAAVAVDYSNPSSSERAGKVDIFFTPSWMNATSFSGPGGSSVDVSSHSSFGFGIAYNLTNNWEFGLLFNGGSSNYTATSVQADGTQQKYSNTMYTSTVAATAAYNFMSGPLTPYVGANVGFTYIDSNIPTGNWGSGCWYDPWWGEVCGNYPTAYTSSNLSYGADIGIRYDINSVCLKAGVGKNFIDWDSTIDTLFYNFQIGFMF